MIAQLRKYAQCAFFSLYANSRRLRCRLEVQSADLGVSSPPGPLQIFVRIILRLVLHRFSRKISERFLSATPLFLSWQRLQGTAGLLVGHDRAAVDPARGPTITSSLGRLHSGAPNCCCCMMGGGVCAAPQTEMHLEKKKGDISPPRRCDSRSRRDQDLNFWRLPPGNAHVHSRRPLASNPGSQLLSLCSPGGMNVSTAQTFYVSLDKQFARGCRRR